MRIARIGLEVASPYSTVSPSHSVAVTAIRAARYSARDQSSGNAGLINAPVRGIVPARMLRP
jgi:hypothetical protein